jgi:hypothetical protein
LSKGVIFDYLEVSTASQSSFLGPLLYLLYTADLSTSPESAAAKFADDTAVLTTDSDPAIASHKLQTNLLVIQPWFRKCRMRANGSKTINLTFTMKETCPPVHTNNAQLPQEDVKYLGLHLDRKRALASLLEAITTVLLSTRFSPMYGTGYTLHHMHIHPNHSVTSNNMMASIISENGAAIYTAVVVARCSGR